MQTYDLHAAVELNVYIKTQITLAVDINNAKLFKYCYDFLGVRVVQLALNYFTSKELKTEFFHSSENRVKCVNKNESFFVLKI